MLSLFSVILVLGVGVTADLYVGVFVLFLLVPFTVLFSVGESSYVLMMESSVGSVMVVLSLWVGALSLLVDSHLKYYPRQYKGAVYFLVFGLLLSFYSANGVLFFMSFESCLVPAVFLIICWGHTRERLEAAIYIAVYASAGGSVHMVGLVILDLYWGSTSFLLNVPSGLFLGDSFLSFIMWWCLILPFLVKSPCYGFHLWLPKAHVEAPTGGSIMLAAVMLKLGVYGVFRYSLILLSGHWWVYLLQCLGVVGGVFSNVVALRQVDVKGAVAYSSVSHMSFTVSALLTNSEASSYAAFVMMVCHGFSSSGLFAWAGIMYSKLQTRNLFIISGLRCWCPAQSFLLIFLLMANVGMPPLLSFFGEFYIFYCLCSSYSPFITLLLFGSLLGMASSLYLFIVTQHSWFSPQSSKVFVICQREWVVLLCHVVPLFLLFFHPYFF